LIGSGAGGELKKVLQAAPIYLLGLRISEAQKILSGRNKNKNKP